MNIKNPTENEKVIILIATIVAIGIVCAIVAAGITWVIYSTMTTPSNVSSVNSSDTVYFFYGQECPHCIKIEPFVENMTEKYPDINIVKLEVWHNQTNQQIYNQVNNQAGIQNPPGVPEVVIGKTVIFGDADIPAELEGYLVNITNN
jgi:thiol-disulfide isomerase/thioredoxin